MIVHEGSRLAVFASRADYDRLLDYVARFRWDDGFFSFAALDRRWVWLTAELPLVQHLFF